MKLEEAIVYLLASSNQGMKTEQIAREINERGLYTRWDKEPVSEKQIWAVVISLRFLLYLLKKYSVTMTQGPSAQRSTRKG